MSIDSSIPLSGLGAQASNPNSAMDSVMNWAKLGQIGQSIEASKQQVEASKASQAQTEAGTPGVAADSAVKQRALRFNDWATNNRNKYLKPDGSIDTRAFNAAASSAGFQQEGAAAATKDLVDTATIIKNTTDEQTRKIALDKYTADSAAHAARYVGNLPPDQQPAALRNVTDFMNQQVPGSGDQTINLLGDIDPKTGQVTVNPNKIAATQEATMSPLEVANLKLSQRQMGVSERSQTLAEKVADPAYKTQIADIRGAEDRVKQAEDAANAGKVVASINQGLTAINDPAIKTLDGKPGAITANVWNSLVGTNGAAQRVDQEVTAYNARHGTSLSIPKDGYNAVQKVLADDSVNISNRAAVAAKQSQAPTATQATSTETNTPPAPVTAPSTGKTATMAHVQDYATRNHMTPAAVIEFMKSKGIQVTK